MSGCCLILSVWASLVGRQKRGLVIRTRSLPSLPGSDIPGQGTRTLGWAELHGWRLLAGSSRGGGEERALWGLLYEGTDPITGLHPYGWITSQTFCLHIPSP